MGHSECHEFSVRARETQVSVPYMGYKLVRELIRGIELTNASIGNDIRKAIRCEKDPKIKRQLERDLKSYKKWKKKDSKLTKESRRK